MRKVEFGLSRDVSADSGWYRILEQEMVPFRVVDGPDAPVILLEGDVPEWVEPFLNQGGVAILMAAEAARAPWLKGDRGCGVVQSAIVPGMDSIQLPCTMDLFSAEGWGEIRIHDKRYTKDGLRNGRFPLVCHQSVGKGHCLFSGAPLPRLLTVLGDTLRTFSPFSAVTERVAMVDKAKIARLLVGTMQRAADLAGMPYPHLWYYPDGAPSVFGFRIDVDGVYPPRLEEISRAAADVGLPLSIFANKNMCANDLPSLRKIHHLHEIGNHAAVHNLYDDESSNLSNVRICKVWLDSESIPNGPWFAAPRGMWNVTLGMALEKLGYEYSSDFGLDYDGLPFFPRYQGRRLNLLQVPIHPWSVERAFVFSEENSCEEPGIEEVLGYWKTVASFQINVHQPAFFYSHPQRFGEMAVRVLPALKEHCERDGARVTTLARYSAWWKMRDSVRFEAEFDTESSTLSLCGDLPADLAVNVISRTSIRLRTGEPGPRTLSNRNRLTA